MLPNRSFITSVIPFTILAAKEAPKVFISSIEKDFSTLSSFSLISSFKSFTSFLSSFTSSLRASSCFLSLPIFFSSFFSESFISATVLDFSKVTSPLSTIEVISSALKPEFSSALYSGSFLNSFKFNIIYYLFKNYCRTLSTSVSRTLLSNLPF